MCLIIERFDVNEFGALIEVCRCGQRRALRGRPVDDVAAEEAAFEARQRELMPSVSSQQPCAWPGCTGFAARSSTDCCAAHCEERRRQVNRDRQRRIADARRKKPWAPRLGGRVDAARGAA